MIGLGATHATAVAIALLLPTGVAWISVIAGLNASIQSFLPAWVRARALSIYQVVLFTTFAVSATVSGIVAQHTSLAVSYYLPERFSLPARSPGCAYRRRRSAPTRGSGQSRPHRLRGRTCPRPSG